MGISMGATKSFGKSLKGCKTSNTSPRCCSALRGTKPFMNMFWIRLLASVHADFASLQMFYPEHGGSGTLRLLAQRGFSAEASHRWQCVTVSTRSTCGEALRTGKRVTVPDVRTCPFMAGSEDLDIYLNAAIRAGQTTPLTSRSGTVLGVLSTYWRQSHEMTERELRSLDVLARLAADSIELSRSEEKLRESEERFRKLADAAPVLIWISGRDKLCTFFNKPWLEFTGRKLEQEIGDGWADSVYPEDLEHCLAVYHSAFDGRQPFQMEYRLRRSDGAYRWILDRGAPLYEAGEFAGFIGSCIDIHDQKLIEEQLRISEARLTDAHRLAKIGSWDRDLRSNVSYWSKEVRQVLGVQEHSSTGLHAFADLVHPKDREKVFEIDSRLRARTDPIETEYRIIRPDGEIRFVRSILKGVRDDQGVPVRVIGAIQDVTEQVEARERLRASEQRLKNAGRLAQVGNWEWNARTNEVSWSEEMFRIFGRSHDFKPSYQGFFESVAPQDRMRLEQMVERSLAEKSRTSGEFQIVLPNGELRVISFVFEVLLDEEGGIERVIGASQDVTEIRRAQQEDFARQKLESIGILASGIAHDFNNVMAGVMAQAELGLEEVIAGSNPASELKSIRDLAIHGAEIVRELMIYAGKETGIVELVDVSNLVDEILALLKFSVSKHAVLSTDLGIGLPKVRANPARLRQVVMNLVTNAADAIGDRAGVIRVATKYEKFAPTSWALAAESCIEGDWVQLEVSDTGCGIPQDQQSKIFDPFFTTKSAGHGLGLAIVQGIVGSLGGSIKVLSDPTKGTTFQILLPAAETETRDTAGHAFEAYGSKQIPKCTVLIVEDETPLRQGLAKGLRMRGMEVLEAPDGRSAIALLGNHAAQIRFVLLDETIPGASSAEVIAEAAKLGPHIGVILTSAYSQARVDEARAPQVKGFIRKPFKFETLIQALWGALSAQANS